MFFYIFNVPFQIKLSCFFDIDSSFQRNDVLFLLVLFS